MSASKAVKAIIFTAQSSEAHTGVKLRNVLKWLKAGHEVRVQITGKADRLKAMEAIGKQIEVEVKTGAKLIQRVVKPESIKFILRPTETASEIVISESKDEDEQIEDLVSGKDVFSEEFQKELMQSIKEESLKRRKK